MDERIHNLNTKPVTIIAPGRLIFVVVDILGGYWRKRNLSRIEYRSPFKGTTFRYQTSQYRDYVKKELAVHVPSQFCSVTTDPFCNLNITKEFFVVCLTKEFFGCPC